MKILAIDTTSDALSCALNEDDTMISCKSENDVKEHSVKLMPMIKQILDENNLVLSDIDLLGCNIGPRIIYWNKNRNSNN